MSRSVLPGVTVYQASFFTNSTSCRSKRNGESAPPVAPLKESLRTFTCASTSAVHSASVRELGFEAGWTMWKTVGIVTLPSGISGWDLIRP